MELYDWLPIYPEFDDDVRLILGDMVNTQQPGYDIYRKKEFYDYKLEREEDPPEYPEKFYHHQIIIARFLSSHTTYNGLLLMHEPGTGKTCSSIAVVEQIRKEKSMKGALILVKNEGLIENYKKDLIKCGEGYEMSESGRISKNVYDFYEFQTFEKFIFKDIFNALEKKESMPNLYEQFIKKYDNKVIIIDEIHNLRNTTVKKDKKNMYRIVFAFLHALSNCKVILMSGTPMTDRPEEIADIMNLILPLDRQLPTKKEFVREFLTKIDQDNEEKEEKEEKKSDEEEESDEDVYEEEEEEEEDEDMDEEDTEEEHDEVDSKSTYVLTDPEKIRKLKYYFHGRVSVLKVMKSTVKREYVGNLYLKNFKLKGVELSDFQKISYEKAYQLDKSAITKTKKGRGVYNHTKQCMAFVFPDGSYGREGFNRYVLMSKKEDLLSEQPYKLKKTTELYTQLSNAYTNEERLFRLRKYSSKYAACIENILKNDGDNHFVYMEFAKGSGAILFARILELFGYKDYSYTRHEGKAKRYAVVTSQTTTNSQLQNIIKYYNKPDNRYGEKLQVIIGTSMISESYSLFNVQHIHILVPDWNFGVIDQAIARGIRLGSHKALINDGAEVNVRIYMYCSTHSEKETTDLYMYKKSQNKDIAIKSVEYAMKQASFDCSLNRQRNSLPSHLDNQRICEYKDCIYQCDGVDEQKFMYPVIDVSTYNLFYDQKDLANIIRFIKAMFNKQTIIKIDEIVRRVLRRSEKYTEITILKAIDEMVSKNEYFVNALGYYCFFRHDNDYLYLTYNIGGHSNFFDNYYVDYFMMEEIGDTQENIESIYYQNLPIIMNEIREEKNEEKKKNLFHKLSIELQEVILEVALSIMEEIKDIKEEQFISYIVNRLSEFWTRLDDGTIISTLLENENRYRCLVERDWEDCREKYLDEIETRKEQEKERLKQSNIGYYGIIDNQDQFFINKNKDREEIRVKEDGSIDNRSSNTGKKCNPSWKLPELLRLIDLIDIEYEDLYAGKNLDTLYSQMTKFDANTSFSQEEFSKKTDATKKRILYWGSKKKGEICERIKKWFSDNQLIERVAVKTDIKVKEKDKAEDEQKEEVKVKRGRKPRGSQ